MKNQILRMMSNQNQQQQVLDYVMKQANINKNSAQNYVDRLASAQLPKTTKQCKGW